MAHSTLGLVAPTRATPVGATDPDGNLAPLLVNADGALKVEASIGDVTIDSADGAITDGVTPAIKATVVDGATRNPLAVTLVDLDGDALAGSAVSLSDGADVNAGTTTDAKVTGDTAGTLAAKLRGLAYLWAKVVDTVNDRLKVDVQTSVLPTGAATSAKQDTGNTSLASLDGKVTAVNTGAVVVASSALPSGAATEGTLDARTGSLTEAAPGTDTASSGINGRLQRIAQRLTSLITALGSPFQAGGSIGNTAFGATQSGTWTVQPGNTANTTAWKVDGSAVTQPVSGTVTANAGTGTLAVSLASVPSHAVTNAGTFAVQAASAGDVAHDGADSGNPVKMGGKATSSEPAAVATGDRANFITDLVGKQITLPYANPENFVSGAITSAMTGTTSTSLVSAPGAGLRNYITTLIVSNAHATVGTDVAIQDGSGGTTLLTIPAAAVYGGAVINLPVPLRQPTTNTALFCANVTTGASTKVSAVGYKGA